MISVILALPCLLSNCGSAPPQSTATASRSQTAQTVTIPATFFGMHVHYPTNQNQYSWPTVQFGAYRSWDDNEGVCWPSIQHVGSEIYDWSALDASVLKTQSEGKEFLYTLGPSPAQPWAVIDSTSYSGGECGTPTAPATSNEPDHTRWQQFITKVVERYCGCTPNSHPTARIHQYEIWNEPSLIGQNGHSTFYLPAVGNTMADSAQSMVELSRIAYNTIKAIDPTAIVVSPSATGDTDGIDWLKEFLAGGGATYADVIGYHMYTDEEPEQMGELVHRVRDIVDSCCPAKPVWNTEAGWMGKPLAFDEPAAWVARAYLLNWSNGAQRFYWYAWDDQWAMSIRLTTGAPPYPGHGDSRNVDGVSSAGIAYGEIYTWLVGATMSSSCSEWESGLWKCELARTGGYHGYIIWSTTGAQSLSLPESWKISQSRDLAGNRTLISNGTNVPVGIKPTLFETGTP